MNWIPHALRHLTLLLCLAAPGVLFAQGYEPDTGYDAAPSGPTRRTPGLFTRLFNSPSQTNAAAQLAVAKEFEKAGRIRKAMKAYKAVFLFWPTAGEAPAALSSYAGLLKNRGKFDAAFTEYQYLIDQYAGRFPYDAVIEAQYAIANQVRTERFGRWFFGIGFVSPERAIPLYSMVASNAPNSRFTPEALFNIGAIYQQNGQYEEAIRAYADLQTQCPDTDEAATAAAEQLECMLGIARREPNNGKHTADTRASLALYLRDHPDTPKRSAMTAALVELDARLVRTLMDRGLVYERANKPGAALKMYRELVAAHPQAPLAEEARRKIEALEKTVLSKEPAHDR